MLSSKFVLEGVPSGRQAADSDALAPSPTTFSNLNDDDVAPAGDIDFSKPSSVTLTLSDGSVITLTGAVGGREALDSGRRAEGCFLERQNEWPRLRNCKLSLRRRYSSPWNNCWYPSLAAERQTRCAEREISPARTLRREETGSRAQAVINGTRAGFGRRLAALVYDAFLLAALLMIFTGGAAFFTHGAAVVPATAGGWVYVYRAGLVLVIAGYYALNWLRSGQTLGMRAWRLRAVSDSGHTADLERRDLAGSALD